MKERRMNDEEHTLNKLPKSIYLTHLIKGSSTTRLNIMNSYNLLKMKKSMNANDTIEEKIKSLSINDTVEYEYTPPNTDIKLKMKIQYLEDSTNQDTKAWVKSIEELIKVSQWDVATSLTVIKGLIRCPKISLKENYKKVEKILNDILKQTLPEVDAQIYLIRLNKIRQHKYFWIKEYAQEIQETLNNYAMCARMTKKETKRRYEECFHYGLHSEVKIEMQKLKLMKSKHIIEHISSIERILKEELENFNHAELKNKSRDKIKQYNSRQLEPKPYRNKKWCSIHNSFSHDLKECRANTNNDAKNDYKNFKGKSVEQRNFKDASNKSFLLQKESYKKGLLEIKLCSEGKTLYGIIDTGSEFNYISKNILQEINKPAIKCEEFKLTCANGIKCEISSKVKIEFTIDPIEDLFVETFYILGDENDLIILGNIFSFKNSCIYDFSTRSIVIKNNIMSMELSNQHEISNDPKNIIVDDHCYILKGNRDKIFKRINNLKIKENVIGCFNEEEFRIELSDNNPIQINQYPVPLKYQADTKLLIQDLLKQEVIRYSKSIYTSPVFVVKKPNKEIRLVVYFRTLNKKTLKLNFLFPDVQQQILDLKDSQIYSQIDLKSGFYHIKIAEKDKFKTSFLILNEQFEFNRMAMGLTNAPRFFQRCISRLFLNKPFVKVFVDDLLIFSRNEEEHEKHIEEVLDILEQNNLTIRIDKSSFFKAEVKYLGMIITKEGIQPDKKQFTSLNKYINPKGKKDIMKLLGFLNWFRPFIKNLSLKIKPISDLLSEKKKFVWDEKMESSLEEILLQIENFGTLKYPDLNETFYIECDASKFALGGIVYQKKGIIGYFSYKLKSYEINYNTMEKEIFSIYKTLSRFRNILLGTNIEIKSDNKNILHKNKDFGSRIARWQLLINEYNPMISHIKGNHNTCSDYISRCLNLRKENKLINKIKLINEDLKFNRFDKTEDSLRILHKKLGHPGYLKLVKTLEEVIPTQGLKKTIKDLVKKCLKCQLYKTYKGKDGLIKGSLISEKPLEKISMDILGPFLTRDLNTDITSKKFWLLTITDLFSKYTKVYIIKSLKSRDVLNILKSRWIKKLQKPY